MSIFSRLGEKSWETPGALAFEDPADYRPSAERVGLWVYFAVAAVLFGLITASYIMRMGSHGAANELPAHDWVSIPTPALLWINSAMLILASIAWETARTAAGRGRDTRLRHALFAAGALGFLFLAGQLVVWRELHEAGWFLSAPALCLSDWSSLDQPTLHFVSANPAVAFFYLITAVHGLHIAGGLAAWGRAIVRAADGIDVRGTIGLCATYWHFLLVVWLAMFGLILAT